MVYAPRSGSVLLFYKSLNNLHEWDSEGNAISCKWSQYRSVTLEQETASHIWQLQVTQEILNLIIVAWTGLHVNLH